MRVLGRQNSGFYCSACCQRCSKAVEGRCMCALHGLGAGCPRKWDAALAVVHQRNVSSACWRASRQWF